MTEKNIFPINFFVIKYFRFWFIFHVKTATVTSSPPLSRKGRGDAHYEIFIPKSWFTESCSCNILFCLIGLANFMSQLDLL